MKRCESPLAMTAAILSAALLLPAGSVFGQSPASAISDDKAKAARAKRIAEQFEAQARVLTVFDRQGKIVTTVGGRAIYNEPVFSPDGSRLVVRKRDLESETEDIWVLDIATGTSTRITASRRGEQIGSAVWSPDGNQLAYVALREGYQSLYRKASNGAGSEELLYRYPGAGMILSDWSLDGRFLSFSSTNLSGGTLYALPLGGDGLREPIELFHSEHRLLGSSFSPDSRFLSYASNQSGKNEIYVRPLDLSKSPETARAEEPRQVSQQGGTWAFYSGWARDGKELYFLAADRGVMAVEVRTAPTLKFGDPKLLFRLAESVPIPPGVASASRDGTRVVIAVPHAPTLQQITMFDQQGKVVRKVAEPGRYGTPALSPDGTRVAVVKIDPRTDMRDVWTFDVASGKGVRITSDTPSTNSTLISPISPVWSPDGKQLAYVSTRGNFTSIYRKASDGTGPEQHLFQHTPGAWIVLTDWSADGRFLTFYSGGVLFILPLSGDQTGRERKAIEWLRGEYNVSYGLFSPDSTSIAYVSDENEGDTTEIYVRSFDAYRPATDAASAKPAKVSAAGGRAVLYWRPDGKEMYYLTRNWEMMAVEWTTSPTFQAGTPKLLFKLPGIPGNPREWVRNVSRDGQRFVFSINVPASWPVR